MKTYENEENEFRRELSELLLKYRADLVAAYEYEQYTGHKYLVTEVTFEAIVSDTGQIVRPNRTFNL